MTESYGSIRLPRSFSLPSSLYQLSRIKLRNSFDGSQPVRRQTYNIDFNLTCGHISVHHERNIMLTVNHTGLADSSLFPAYARPVPVVLSSPTFPPFPPGETASAIRDRSCTSVAEGSKDKAGSTSTTAHRIATSSLVAGRTSMLWCCYIHMLPYHCSISQHPTRLSTSKQLNGCCGFLPIEKTNSKMPSKTNAGVTG